MNSLRRDLGGENMIFEGENAVLNELNRWSNEVSPYEEDIKSLIKEIISLQIPHVEDKGWLIAEKTFSGVYNPNEDEIKLAETFATLNSPNFNGVQRIYFLKIGNQLLLSELEDDSPYMAIEALSLSQREQFIDDFKQMVYQYYDNFKKETTRVLKR